MTRDKRLQSIRTTRPLTRNFLELGRYPTRISVETWPLGSVQRHFQNTFRNTLEASRAGRGIMNKTSDTRGTISGARRRPGSIRAATETLTFKAGRLLQDHPDPFRFFSRASRPHFLPAAGQSLAWTRRPERCAYERPHREHRNGRAPVCRRSCTESASRRANRHAHTRQACGRSPECVRRCVLRCPPWEKARPHSSHMNRRSPSCTMRVCVRSSDANANRLPQCSHW